MLQMALHLQSGGGSDELEFLTRTAQYRLPAAGVVDAVREQRPQKHPKSQIKKIAESLKAYGWTNPLIIDGDGGILCGHGRYQAALQLRMESVPTVTLDYLSEADRKAYIIADNAIAQKAGWSRGTLASELSGLAEIGYDLELTGFETLEIETLLAIGEDQEHADDDVELPTETE